MTNGFARAITFFICGAIALAGGRDIAAHLFFAAASLLIALMVHFNR